VRFARPQLYYKNGGSVGDTRQFAWLFKWLSKILDSKKDNCIRLGNRFFGRDLGTYLPTGLAHLADPSKRMNRRWLEVLDQTTRFAFSKSRSACPTDKVKLNPPATCLSASSSRRRSGLIAIKVLYLPEKRRGTEQI